MSSLDQGLGALEFDQDGGWWKAKVEISGRQIGFKIAGDVMPNKLSVARAHEIVQRFEEFDIMVSAFLAAEMAKFENSPDDIRESVIGEIKKLQIDDICLLSARSPENGMIYFKGSEHPGLWRCDYKDGKAEYLGCDT